MMIYVIPKDDDKPIKIVFEGGKGSNSIIEDDQVYFIDEHPSPEEVGKAFRTLYERLMSIEEEALEKQIPRKRVEVRNEIVCPTCKTLVGSSPYCRYCGQALDWSDTE